MAGVTTSSVTTKSNAEAYLILMADSRSPHYPDRLTAPYHALAAAINLNYAKHHGYDFRYYQFAPLDEHPQNADTKSADAKNGNQGDLLETIRWHIDWFTFASLRQLSPLTTHYPRLQARLGRNYARLRRLFGHTATENPWLGKAKSTAYCRHPVYGTRAAPWGKLPAIEHAMQSGYTHVVYIDSDAVFANPKMRIEQFLESNTSTLAPLESAELVLLHSRPYARELANSGFMVWRNTPAARALLAQWWDVDAGEFHHYHDFEQYALKHTLLEDPERQNNIAIVADDCFVETRGQFIRHVASPNADERVPRFRAQASRTGLSTSRFRTLIAELDRYHLHTLDCSSVAFQQLTNARAAKSE